MATYEQIRNDIWSRHGKYVACERAERFEAATCTKSPIAAVSREAMPRRCEADD